MPMADITADAPAPASESSLNGSVSHFADSTARSVPSSARASMPVLYSMVYRRSWSVRAVAKRVVSTNKPRGASAGKASCGTEEMHTDRVAITSTLLADWKVTVSWPCHTERSFTSTKPPASVLRVNPG